MTDQDFADWIGRSEVADDVVTPRLVREFRATLSPHLAEFDGADAPLGSHWCLAPPARPTEELGPDGHPARGEFLPPIPLPRRMWAGGEIEFLEPLRVGHQVTRRSTIESVERKDGRSGTLWFVAVRHELRSDGRLAIRERQDLVYRDVGTSTPRQPPAEKRGVPELSGTVMASPVLLFRYSALTFNGHRIHYDFPYVTEVEGYPGLIVHGPLQATLLMNLAARIGGRTPARFSYRGTSPLIAGAPFEILAERTEGGAECRAIGAGGQVTMTAQAAW